ncbi:MAG: BglG family transcription antiterminator LicT [Candidatus Ornithomonoglobus sp.]
MKIIKTINNNTVCVVGKNGKEQIVSGKGIGFGKKSGDYVDPKQIQKTYFITSSSLQNRLIELMSEIPYEYIKFTNDMVSYINEKIPSRLNDSLLITLSDHISFAIERKKRGIEFTNPLMDSIRECYPLELELGMYCVEQLRERLGISLIPDEAGFIAMHIVNAQLDTKMSDVYDITKMLNGCIEIVEYFYSKKLDRSRVTFERFMVHLKYLAQRLLENKPVPQILSNDRSFVEMIKNSCANHYKCAECIQEYILKTHNKTISEDELITLTIHLKKISFDC